MCGICGCGGSEARIGPAGVGAAQGGGHDHGQDHGHGHGHGHDHGHDHDGDHDHHHDARHPHDHSHDPQAARSPARSQGVDTASRVIQVERDLLEANDRLAAVNRELFASAGVLALNLVSSPGAGKTTLLVRSLQALKGRWPLAVIEGDQETDNDAARVRATGVPAVQVNTGKGCHLDARMVFRSFESLPLPRGGVLFIENVGNLVCPAGFDPARPTRWCSRRSPREYAAQHLEHACGGQISAAGQQGRPAAAPALRRRGADRECATHQSAHRGAAGLGRDRRRLRGVERLDRARARCARGYQCRPRSRDVSASPSFDGLTSTAAPPLAAAVSGNIW
ncbi:MAG: hydrogenase nickel incorporation protein HypB [Steroidobacteraceae bacterium]